MDEDDEVGQAGVPTLADRLTVKAGARFDF